MIRTVELYGRPEEFSSTQRAMLYAELVKLASPVVECYLSDLYHDAQWVEAQTFADEFTFYYGTRDTGTHISTRREFVMDYSDNAYRIEVHAERRGWTLKIDEIKSFVPAF